MKATAGALPSFSDRVLRFLERIEHRIAKSDSEREEVFRLRYDAYVRNGLLEPRSDQRLFDARYDDAANTLITMTFLEGELAGSVRVTIGVGVDPDLPSHHVYSDVLRSRLRAGQIAIEYNRLAAKLSLSSAHPELAYIIMRPGYMAAKHLDVDFAVTTPRPDHMGFYRRVFQFVPWCEPRRYPGFTPRLACMGVDFKQARAQVEARYPFYRSTPVEREALFGPRGRGIEPGFPSANVASRTRLSAELVSSE